MIKKALLTLVMASTIPGAAFAASVDHTHCKDPGRIYVEKMGMVDEAILQEHIADMEKQVQKAQRVEAKSSQHRKFLEMHMRSMQTAMKKIHEGVDAEDCLSQAQDVDPQDKMRAMEKRMQTMQRMMDQMIKHQSEAEK